MKELWFVCSIRRYHNVCRSPDMIDVPWIANRSAFTKAVFVLHRKWANLLFSISISCFPNRASFSLNSHLNVWWSCEMPSLTRIDKFWYNFVLLCFSSSWYFSGLSSSCGRLPFSKPQHIPCSNPPPPPLSVSFLILAFFLAGVSGSCGCLSSARPQRRYS